MGKNLKIKHRDLNQIQKQVVSQCMRNLHFSFPDGEILNSDKSQRILPPSYDNWEQYCKEIERRFFGEDAHSDCTQGQRNQDLLAWYNCMKSPGIITFHLKNIADFYLYIAYRLLQNGHSLDEETAELIAYYVFKKTLYHHYADFNRLFSRNFPGYNESEEAFAVACSRLFLGFDGDGSTLFEEFCELAYQFKQRGYKDWVDHKTENKFKQNLKNFVGYPVQLINDNFMNTLIPITFESLVSILENPNVKFETYEARGASLGKGLGII